jgi:hypothetical protein
LWRQPPAPPRRATFLLHRDLSRLRDLREVLQRLLRSWRLEGRTDEDTLVLLTSEVGANAILHTGSDAVAVVSYLGPVVQVAVLDDSSLLPSLRAAGEADMSGRGIALVEALAAKWGTHATPAGKVVWFEMAVTDR